MRVPLAFLLLAGQLILAEGFPLHIKTKLKYFIVSSLVAVPSLVTATPLGRLPSILVPAYPRRGAYCL